MRPLVCPEDFPENVVVEKVLRESGVVIGVIVVATTSTAPLARFYNLSVEKLLLEELVEPLWWSPPLACLEDFPERGVTAGKRSSGGVVIGVTVVVTETIAVATTIFPCGYALPSPFRVMSPRGTLSL